MLPYAKAAIGRLRAYTPPATQYYSLPLSRRAAVLILLYPDHNGELRVVLTMRAKTLSSYAGQAALPGGRADSISETPTETARREAMEEIGLPLSDAQLPSPFRIHHLCQLPTNLARTELGVRPCVAYIDVDPARTAASVLNRSSGYGTLPSPSSSSSPSSTNPTGPPPVPLAEDALIPRLDAKEVAAVFTAPFRDFLRASRDMDDNTLPALSTAPSMPPDSLSDATSLDPRLRGSQWYRGAWTTWYNTPWRMHNFYVPSADQRVAWAEKPATTVTMNRFRVFGMTARILVDAARVAFGEEPEFECNEHVGDEELIARLVREGRLGEKEGQGERGRERSRERSSERGMAGLRGVGAGGSSQRASSQERGRGIVAKEVVMIGDMEGKMDGQGEAKI